MPAVAVERLAKRYGGHTVIDDVSFAIESGEFVVLVGPSGCGKSTLLRMIAGLDVPSDGRILIDGKIVNDASPSDRDIAMVFQSYALYPQMTVEQNLGFSLKLSKAPKEEIQRKVSAAASMLGLEPLLGRYPKQLSGGQRQRVAMGRAMVRNPRVFLFDEPLSNLDAQLRVQMRAEIKALHQKLSTSCIYVTHDQVEAMTLADKIVVLRGGRVEQVGAPLDLFDYPANTFVATFIGSPAMNLLQAVVAEDAGREPFAQLADRVRAPLPKGFRGYPGQKIVYGIRPEHLSLSDRQGIPLAVTVIEAMGSETILAGESAGQPVTGLIRRRVQATPGETILLEPDAASVHVFDPETGLRLNTRNGAEPAFH